MRSRKTDTASSRWCGCCDRFLTLNLLGTVGTLLTQVVPLLAALFDPMLRQMAMAALHRARPVLARLQRRG